MEVGDALVGIHHGQIWAHRHGLLDGCFDGGAVFHGLEFGHQGAKSVVEVHAGCIQRRAVLVQDGLEEGADSGPKQDGVRDLHHGRLHVKGEQRAVRLDAVDFRSQKRFELFHGQGRAVDDLTGLQCESTLQHGALAALAHVHEVHRRDVGNRHTFL